MEALPLERITIPRLGIQELQVTGQTKATFDDDKKLKLSVGTGINAGISFAKPSFTPTISIPYTSSQKSLTFKLGDRKNGHYMAACCCGIQSKRYVGAR